VTFFEQSFEEFCYNRGYKRDDTARIIWRGLAETKWDTIKRSPHYHAGLPCRDAHGAS
jgi:hypothetical protein